MKSLLTSRSVSLAVFFLLGCCSALAGTCPSSVPSGVTNCYFIAANGSDSNTGADEAHPWLMPPGVPNCTANCATLNANGLPAGTGLIFRGGDTWHFDNSSDTTYTGGVGKYAYWEIYYTWNGTATNPIYIGVDKTWYSGSSWHRPIFDLDNPTSTTAVASCAYPNSTRVLNLSTNSYIIVDNLEFTGGCWTGNNAFQYIDWAAETSTEGHNTVENVYVHGWTHTPGDTTNCPGTPIPGDSCQGSYGISGRGDGSRGAGDKIDNFVCDGADSDPDSFTCIFNDCYEVIDSYMNDTANGMICQNAHIVHDDIIQNIHNPYDNAAHANGFEFVAEWPGTNYVYDLVQRNISAAVSGWVCPNATDYYWNIVSYNNPSEAWAVDTSCGGTVNFFNSTFIDESIGNGANSWGGQMSNMLLVNTSISNFAGTSSNNVSMTDAQATKAGITSNSAFPYQLTSTTCNGVTPCPVNTGANLSSSWPAGFPTDDTTFACTYVTSNHTMSCPARTPVKRPSASGSPAPPWDVGAYEFGTLTSSAPAPPSNLAAIVN